MSLNVGRALGVTTLGAVAVIALVWASMSAADSYRIWRSDQFWNRLWFSGASAPHFDSMEEMQAASDVVVLGTIIQVEEGRIFGDPHPDNPHPEEELVAYVTATIEIDRVLVGSLEDPGAARIRLELPMPRQDAVRELVGDGPAEPAVFFVFNAGRLAAAQGRPLEIQEIEREYYALVAFGAVVRNFDGKAAPIDAPEMEFLKAFESEPFDRFVERLDTAP
jgi:hypothetical protein